MQAGGGGARDRDQLTPAVQNARGGGGRGGGAMGGGRGGGAMGGGRGGGAMGGGAAGGTTTLGRDGRPLNPSRSVYVGSMPPARRSAS